MLQCTVRLAREDAPGQYMVHDEAAVLRIDAHTLSLLAHPHVPLGGAAPAPSAVFHVALRSIWLGLGANKLMVVPVDRGCEQNAHPNKLSMVDCSGTLPMYAWGTTTWKMKSSRMH